MMSLVYQLYNHIQIDTFGLFFQLNNRFEYDNLWRFDMKVCPLGCPRSRFLKIKSQQILVKNTFSVFFV